MFFQKSCGIPYSYQVGITDSRIIKVNEDNIRLIQPRIEKNQILNEIELTIRNNLIFQSEIYIFIYNIWKIDSLTLEAELKNIIKKIQTKKKEIKKKVN